MSTLHELKAWPREFQAVVRGRKRFEFRRNDRGFAVGDILWLREWLPESRAYTGDTVFVVVTYLLPGGEFGVPEGYCVMSIAPGAPREPAGNEPVTGQTPRSRNELGTSGNVGTRTRHNQLSH